MSFTNNNIVKDKLHPCCFDMSHSPRAKRKTQQGVAQRISRKRMLKRNANELAPDGSNVVHRTGIQYGDYSSDALSSYVQVEFLNQHDIVLAGGQNGCIDIVKLDRYMPPPSSDDDCSFEPSRPHRPLGTLLASKVQTNTGEPVHCLKGLQGGHAFVVGQRGGNFTVFGTEDASSYASKAATRPATQQRLPNQSALELRHRLFHDAPPLFDSYKQYYDTVDDMRRILAIHREGAQSTVHYPGRPSSMFLNPRCEYAWNFREVSSSTLLASFLERETNSVSIATMDSRASTESVSLSLVETGKTPFEFNETAGHATSACFISDYYLVTLHMWRNPSIESSTTSVKIWDIRALARTNNSSPVAESILSPRAYDINGNVTPTESTLDLDTQVQWDDSPAQARLTPSSNDDGTLMANIVTNQGVAESYLIHANTASVVKQYRTRSAVASTNAISPTLDCLACYDTSTLSLYDFSGRTKASSTPPKGKKRSRDSTEEDLDDDHCLIGSIAPKIEDEMGIRARLNCLAFNKTGTSLVGGTDAGDLFLWRGG